MSLTYGVQPVNDLIGTESSPETLTTDYADTTGVIATGSASQMTVYVDYTTGSGGGSNSIQLEVSGSGDKKGASSPVYYQDVGVSLSGGTATLSQAEYTFTASAQSTSYKLRIFIPLNDTSVQIRTKETVAGGSAGTVSVRYTLGGVS